MVFGWVSTPKKIKDSHWAQLTVNCLERRTSTRKETYNSLKSPRTTHSELPHAENFNAKWNTNTTKYWSLREQLPVNCLVRTIQHEHHGEKWNLPLRTAHIELPRAENFDVKWNTRTPQKIEISRWEQLTVNCLVRTTSTRTPQKNEIYRWEQPILNCLVRTTSTRNEAHEHHKKWKLPLRTAHIELPRADNFGAKGNTNTTKNWNHPLRTAHTELPRAVNFERNESHEHDKTRNNLKMFAPFLFKIAMSLVSSRRLLQMPSASKAWSFPPSLQHSTEYIAKENVHHESLIRQSYPPQFAFFPPQITNWKHSNTVWKRPEYVIHQSFSTKQLCILLFHLNMSLLMHQLSLIRQGTYFYGAVPWCTYSWIASSIG